MERFVEFPTASGSKLIIETTYSSLAPASTNPALAGKVTGIGDAVNRIASEAKDLFENALATVTSTHARAFSAALEKLNRPPSEATLEFGLKASAEFGNVVVSKVVGESNYTIKLTWKDFAASGEPHESA